MIVNSHPSKNKFSDLWEINKKSRGIFEKHMIPYYNLTLKLE